MPASIHGVLVVHKPVGPSSHDIVICARRSLGISRIGHTGTLDPQASGVLPLVLGQATRLAQFLTSSDKEYEATVRFGVETDSYDAAGQIVRETGNVPDPDAVSAVLPRFRGTFDQEPPLYSAKMVGGERSYVRAREGKPVQPPAVSVTVHALELLTIDGAVARLRVRCSAGFYVRSLAHDLGRALGTGAILQALVRVESAGFRISDAVPFEALVTAPRAELREQVRPMEALLLDLPAAHLTPAGVDRALHGRDLGPDELSGEFPGAAPLTRLLAPDGRLVGLSDRAKTPGLLHPAVIFSYN